MLAQGKLPESREETTQQVQIVKTSFQRLICLFDKRLTQLEDSWSKNAQILPAKDLSAILEAANSS